MPVYNSQSLAFGRLDETTGCVSLTTQAAEKKQPLVVVVSNNNHKDDEEESSSSPINKRYDEIESMSRKSEAETVETSSDCSTDDNSSNNDEDEDGCCMGNNNRVPLSEPDIYGQRHPIENDTLIALKLVDFDFEVKQLDEQDKIALIMAQKQCPSLLTDPFKLMFLRCECFNATKAATRYAKYWTKRLAMFGSARAFCPMTAQSMAPDIRPLTTGSIQVIRRAKTDPNADERDYLFMDTSKLEPSQYSKESGCRAMWYFFHTLLEDEQVQKRGMIAVSFNAHATNRNRDPRLMRMCVNSFLGCLPIRLSAFHVCHPPTIARLVVAVFSTVIGERLRRRVLMHTGNYETVVQHLEKKFRIPGSAVPMDMGGSLRLDIDAWLAQRTAENR